MDGAILIHELIHFVALSKNKGLVLKLDMNKAFDRVNWAFLLQITKKFGFSDDWIQWIKSLIKNPSFSFLINGSAQGLFWGSRGLHQGDPLSPYLFIIVEEALGRGIHNLQVIWCIYEYHINQSFHLVTHS